MHLIDNPWAIPTKPAPQAVGTPGWFQPGDDTTQLLATVVDYDWANTIQAELANVVTNAGLTLDKTNDAQLVQSMITIARREGGVGAFLPLVGGTLTGALFTTGAAATMRTFGAQTAAVMRWQIDLADSAPETGANAGSNFALVRYADNGTMIDAPMAINRASGVVDFAKPFTIAGLPPAGGTGGGRPVAPAATTYYVNYQTGIDTALGTTPTTALRTAQAAFNKLKTIDLGGYNATIIIQGTFYPETLVCDGPLVGGVVTIQGSSGDVTLDVNHNASGMHWDTGLTGGNGGPCIIAQNGATIWLNQLYLCGGYTGTVATMPGAGVSIRCDNSTVNFQNVVFGPSLTADIQCVNNGTVTANGAAYKMGFHNQQDTTRPQVRSNQYHVFADTHGQIVLTNCHVTGMSQEYYYGAFAVAQGSASIQAAGYTTTNLQGESDTESICYRAGASQNALINCGTSRFPGMSSPISGQGGGSYQDTATGGVYVGQAPIINSPLPVFTP